MNNESPDSCEDMNERLNKKFTSTLITKKGKFYFLLAYQITVSGKNENYEHKKIGSLQEAGRSTQGSFCDVITTNETFKKNKSSRKQPLRQSSMCHTEKVTSASF